MKTQRNGTIFKFRIDCHNFKLTDYDALSTRNIFGAILLLLELFAAYVVPYGSYEPLCTVSQTTDRVPVRSTYYTHFTHRNPDIFLTCSGAAVCSWGRRQLKTFLK